MLGFDRLLVQLLVVACVVLTLIAAVQWHGKTKAKRALLEYQAAAAQVIAQRIEENARKEEAARLQAEGVRRAYEKSLADTRARYERLRHTTASPSGSAVPQTSTSDPRAVDAGGYELPLPRCVDAARREQFLDLLERADHTNEALKACQDYVRGLSAK